MKVYVIKDQTGRIASIWDTRSAAEAAFARLRFDPIPGIDRDSVVAISMRFFVAEYTVQESGEENPESESA